MNHPFALELSELQAVDLEFEEPINFEDAARIDGGISPSDRVVTKALHETGGWNYPPIKPPIKPPVTKPPKVTTLALGEEGGSSYIYCL